MSPVQLLYERYQDDAYIASKGGIIVFTQALAGEIGADGINVTVIAPGLSSTKTMKGVNEEIFDLLPTLQAIPRVVQPEDLVGVFSLFKRQWICKPPDVVCHFNKDIVNLERLTKYEFTKQ